MEKEYLLFAGVNGAGKSTLYNLCSGIPQNRINPDEILRANGGNWKSSTDQANAMKEAVKRIKDYFKMGFSFNQETTLAGNSIINHINKAKEQGYIVNVYYVGLESADLAIQRVQQRVEKGGHGIAQEDIRRRYVQSLNNLKKIIPICDKVVIYDNTKNFLLVASFVNGSLKFKRACKWLDNTI